MQTRRSTLKLIGSASAISTGTVLSAGSASAAEAASTTGQQVDNLWRYTKQFASVTVSVDSVPEDAVVTGGSKSRCYLRGNNAIFLQGTATDYEPSDDDDFLLSPGGSSIVPLQSGDGHSLTDRSNAITAEDGTSFIGSYGSDIDVSTTGANVEVTVGDDGPVTVTPNSEQSVESDVTVAYRNDRDEERSATVTVTTSVEHAGNTKIVQHPSMRVVPSAHDQGVHATRGYEKQKQNGGRPLELTDGSVRFVPVRDAKAFVIDREYDWAAPKRGEN